MIRRLHAPFASEKQNPRQAKRNRQLDFATLEPRQLLANVTSADLGGQWGLDAQHELSVRQYLDQQSDTDYLQQGANELQLVEIHQQDGQTFTRFQQTHQGISIYGAYITVVQNGEGDFESTHGQGIRDLNTRMFLGPQIVSGQAEQFATDDLGSGDVRYDSTAEPVWYLNGNRASLGWQVNTFVERAAEFLTPGDYISVVDAFSGDVLSHAKSTDYHYDFAKDGTGVFERIVINDAIGAAGSRAYAAPFDAVAALELGCTGTLIASNVVLSARHCGAVPGDRIRFGDNSNSPDYIATVASVSDPAGSGSLLDGGDVQILTLTQNVPTSVADPMRLIDETSALEGITAATIGYGYNGVGSQGHQFTADDWRWGGENIIDVYGSPAGATGQNIFSTDFDDGTGGNNTISGSDPNPLQYEATTAPGDSGGPLLVEVAGEWVIAGVLSGGTTSTSVYGDISWWTGTSNFRQQIEAVGGQYVGGGLGEVDLDKSNYLPNDLVNILVQDVNAVTPVTVTLTSDSGDSETVTLTFDTNYDYIGSINTDGGAVSTEDGTLQVAIGDLITVTYVDPDDGTGNSATLTDTANISNIREYSSNDVPVNIIDNATVKSTLQINDGGTINDLDIQLDITHTWVEDLQVDLVSPAGTTVNLFTFIGGDGDNFSNTVLDDEASTPINQAGAPFAGSYIPNQLLEAFDGEQITGTWSLCIYDDFTGDQGTLNSWSLFIDAREATAGTVSFDRDSYNVGDTVIITVFDANQAQPITVDLTSTSGEVETLTLQGSNGVYTQQLTVNAGPVNPSDGNLQVNLGDILTVSFTDDDDGQGSSNTVSDTAVIDNIIHYESTDVPVPISDFTTVYSDLVITDTGTIADVDVQINITHTYDSDIELFLIAPDGTRVELFTDVGGNLDNFDDTILDDEATTIINFGTAPFPGSYIPEGDLSTLDGKSITGTWQLEIYDDANGDVGTLNDWCLFINVIPEQTAPDIGVTGPGAATEDDSVVFTVSLSQTSSQTVTVDYATTNAGFANPATPGVDYTPAAGTLTFLPGELTKTVNITTLGDAFAEADEQFGLDISNATNGNIVDASESVVINDNDLFSLGVPIDFGTPTSAVASNGVGFVDLEYDASHGIGWVNPVGLSAIERTRGNAITVDIAALRSADFWIDIPNGTYNVKATFGVVRKVDAFQFEVEGQPNTLTLQQGPNVSRNFTATVNDGQLNFTMIGNPGLDNQMRISALEVTASGARSNGGNGPSDKNALAWRPRSSSGIAPLHTLSVDGFTNAIRPERLGIEGRGFEGRQLATAIDWDAELQTAMVDYDQAVAATMMEDGNQSTALCDAFEELNMIL